jgi:very-short-patch-repair endonuclease
MSLTVIRCNLWSAKNMSLAISDDENFVFAALNKANLLKGMVKQQTIILKVTLPDFCWPLKKKAVYLDGIQVHRKAHVEKRDEEINQLMEQKGWQILRIPYEPPLTQQEIQDITQQIQQFIQTEK